MGKYSHRTVVYQHFINYGSNAPHSVSFLAQLVIIYMEHVDKLSVLIFGITRVFQLVVVVVVSDLVNK